MSRVKVLPEVKQGYMTFEQFLYYEKKEAAEAAAFEERIHFETGVKAGEV